MLEALDLRNVRVAVDDRLTVSEPGRKARLAPEPRPGVVNHPDLDVPHLDDSLLRQHPLQRLLVHVPADGLDGRPERLQLRQEVRRDEIAAVQDEIRGGDESHALVR